MSADGASEKRFARNAIALEDPDAVVVATEGYLDVFAVASGEAGAAGALHHLLRAQAAQPLVGAVSPPAGVERLLAVPGPGAEVGALTRGDWLELQEDEPIEEVVELLAEAVWQWAAETAPERHPEPVTRLVPGERPLAQRGAHLACDFGTVAVRVRSGRVAYLGSEAATLGAGDIVLLTRHGWLTVLEDAEIAVQRLDALDELKDASRAYENFQRLCLLAACAARGEQERGGAERLKRRAQGIEHGLDEGLLRMRRLLDPAARLERDVASGQEAILSCARAVAERQGIDLVELAAEPGLRASAYVQALAEVSGVRVRSVTLAGEWWMRDSGPLLAFRAEDEAPVALFTGPGRRYFAQGVRGDAVRMSRAVAAGLKPYAFAFYRPFPHQAMGVMDLVRFGLAGQGRDVGPVLGLAALIAVLGLLLPIATAEVVDNVIPSAQKSVLLQLGLVLLCAAAVQSLFSLARGLFLLRIGDTMEHNIQAAVWDRVLALPIDFFREFSVGDLAMRVNAVNMLYRMLSVGTITTLLSGVFALLNFVVLLRFSVALSLLAAGLVFAAAFALAALFWFTLHRLEALVPTQRRIMALVFQLVQGIAKLRTTASEARAFGLWSGEFANFRAIRLLILRLQAQQQVFFAGFQHFGTLLVFAAMAALLARPGGSGLTAGEFVGFFAAFGALFMGVISVCETVVGLFLVPIMYKMAKPILEALPETAAGKTDPGRISGAIEVSQASFAYPGGDPVLDDVSFSVPAGSFTAIVGPSGSGKSTLLRLLLGFDPPGGGAILYDDRNLTDLDQRKLRRQFGVVLQGSPLMAGDLFSNIVGVSGGTIDDAWEAARLAGIAEDIEAMPMGMHTAVGEGMSTLSGGQRQRVLIARALAGRPRVLFLDEATSALDNRSQAAVSKSLLRMKATRVVIAHRLSTIARADQIVVLDGGRVVQQGTYEELIAQEGLFAELARRQSVGEPEAAAEDED